MSDHPGATVQRDSRPLTPREIATIQRLAALKASFAGNERYESVMKERKGDGNPCDDLLGMMILGKNYRLLMKLEDVANSLPNPERALEGWDGKTSSSEESLCDEKGSLKWPTPIPEAAEEVMGWLSECDKIVLANAPESFLDAYNEGLGKRIRRHFKLIEFFLGQSEAFKVSSSIIKHVWERLSAEGYRWAPISSGQDKDPDEFARRRPPLDCEQGIEIRRPPHPDHSQPAELLPKTIEEAVDCLELLANEETLLCVKLIPRVHYLHHNLGLFVRNNFGLWRRDAPLGRWGTNIHADYLSGRIISALRDRLRGKSTTSVRD